MKKNNSKAIALLVFILMAFSINAQKHIQFMHIGSTDKYIKCVKIYPSLTEIDSLGSNQDDRISSRYFVKESLFDSLYYYIKQNKMKPLTDSVWKACYFGSFSVSYEYDKEIYKIAVSREDAIHFFEGIIPMIKNVRFLYSYKGTPPDIWDYRYLYWHIDELILSRLKSDAYKWRNSNKGRAIE